MTTDTTFNNHLLDNRGMEKQVLKTPTTKKEGNQIVV